MKEFLYGSRIITVDDLNNNTITFDYSFFKLPVYYKIYSVFLEYIIKNEYYVIDEKNIEINQIFFDVALENVELFNLLKKKINDLTPYLNKLNHHLIKINDEIMSYLLENYKIINISYYALTLKLVPQLIKNNYQFTHHNIMKLCFYDKPTDVLTVFKDNNYNFTFETVKQFINYNIECGSLLIEIIRNNNIDPDILYLLRVALEYKNDILLKFVLEYPIPKVNLVDSTAESIYQLINEYNLTDICIKLVANHQINTNISS